MQNITTSGCSSQKSCTSPKNVAPRPTTNIYVSERSGSNDAINVAIVDDIVERVEKDLIPYIANNIPGI